MALYVYGQTDGTLVSWCPSDADPVASDEELAANGLAKVAGLTALDSTHAWDAATRTVVVVAAPVPEKYVNTGKWIMRFTPQEFDAIVSSADINVKQFVYALNHTTELNVNDPLTIQGVNYMASINLIEQSRIAAILE